jgi:glucokinase
MGGSPDARDARFVVGVDVGGTKVLAGVLDEALEVRTRDERPTDRTDTAHLLAELEDQVSDAIAAAPGPVVALGFGIPATIDQATGTAVFAPNAPLADVPVRAHLERRFGLPVVVDNDANVAAYAEYAAGAARGVPDFVTLTLGTGVGGGVVLGGELFRGATGAGAELGHMVIDIHGPECPSACPGVGCLEAHCSGTALGLAAHVEAIADPGGGLGRRAHAAGAVSALTSRDVVELAEEGDERCRELIGDLGRKLGLALAGLANIFNPRLFVIGGGLAEATGEAVLEPAREVLAKRALRPNCDARVVPAAFGNDAGLIGAAALALRLAG